MFIVDGKEIVILEAALLLDASWNNLVHEVWTSIVPSGEVITSPHSFLLQPPFTIIL
jgi:hypothetical protein